jgi:glycerol-3-phosphate dehydrogenase
VNRQETLTAARSSPDIDVLVIGGGINGIGTFRDLALQRVKVLLADQYDFCSGASAASSRMIHGGLRYLENGEFRLVREALTERNRLLRIAPHQVKPLPTVIPIFKTFSGFFNAPLKFLGRLNRPTERGAIVIKAGLLLYDWFTRKDRTVPPHEFDLRSSSLKKYPQLNSDIIATAVYYDAAIASPERLCLDLIADALAAGPHATAMNYLRAEAASGGAVTLRDLETDQAFDVHPRVVVNAAGPWIDLTNRALGPATRFIGGTKGSHLVLDHPVLREIIAGREYYFENEDGRMVLIYPLDDKVLIGTSDIPIDDPDDARCTEEEVDYFFSMITRVFPEINVDRSQVVFRYSGVRPLPASEVSSTGQISRDHQIKLNEADGGLSFPIFSLVGGKWTSFRAFSEQAADAVLKRLSVPRTQDTRSLPIGGGKGYPVSAGTRRTWLDLAGENTGLDTTRLAALLQRYGTRAQDAAAYIRAGDDHPLKHHPGFTRREVEWLVQAEMAIHLDDIILRRTMLAFHGELSKDLLEELAHIQSETLHWDMQARLAEIDRALSILSDRHQVNL